MSSERDITKLLRKVKSGDRDAEEDLYRLIYPELKRIAASHMRKEAPNAVMQPTVLVHEAYLRLVGRAHLEYADRVHFLKAASVWMRRILVDNARARLTQKRAMEWNAHQLFEDRVYSPERPAEFLRLDDALDRLAQFDERAALIIQMWFFSGMSQEAIGKELGIASRTVKREWRVAKAWLEGEIGRPPTEQ